MCHIFRSRWRSSAHPLLLIFFYCVLEHVAHVNTWRPSIKSSGTSEDSPSTFFSQFKRVHFSYTLQCTDGAIFSKYMKTHQCCAVGYCWVNWRVNSLMFMSLFLFPVPILPVPMLKTRLIFSRLVAKCSKMKKISPSQSLGLFDHDVEDYSGVCFFLCRLHFSFLCQCAIFSCTHLIGCSFTYENDQSIIPFSCKSWAALYIKHNLYKSSLFS